MKPGRRPIKITVTMPDPLTSPRQLVCAECGRVDRDGEGRGWRADLAGGYDGEELEVVVVCPSCWERQFGERPG
jgi:hypothetical protein